MRAVAQITVTPRGPRFDVRRLLRSPMRALRGGEDGIAIAYAPKPTVIEISVFAAGKIDEDEVVSSLDAARGWIGVDDDASEFVALVRDHELLGPLAKRFDARLTRTPTVFESFAEAVIAQLVTSDEARDAKRRLWRTAGALISGTTLRAAPIARAVAAVPSWTMHAIGIGSRRFVTLHEGAKRGVALERLRTCEPEELMQKLMSLRGVGVWTANRVAQNALGYADAVPIDDFHVPRLVTEALTGEREGTNETMLAALEPFRPHRARVVKILEQAWFARSEPVGPPRARPRVDPHRRMPWRY